MNTFNGIMSAIGAISALFVIYHIIQYARGPSAHRIKIERHVFFYPTNIHSISLPPMSRAEIAYAVQVLKSRFEYETSLQGPYMDYGQVRSCLRLDANLDDLDDTELLAYTNGTAEHGYEPLKWRVSYLEAQLLQRLALQLEAEVNELDKFRLSDEELAQVREWLSRFGAGHAVDEYCATRLRELIEERRASLTESQSAALDNGTLDDGTVIPGQPTMLACQFKLMIRYLRFIESRLALIS